MLYWVLIVVLFMIPSRMPDHLNINDIRWQIHYHEKLIPMTASTGKEFPYAGHTDCYTHTFDIYDGMTEAETYLILLHESQHAMACDGNNLNNSHFNNLNVPDQKAFDYHAGIYWATPHWVQFIQDNPEFIRRLQELKPLAPIEPPPYY